MSGGKKFMSGGKKSKMLEAASTKKLDLNQFD